MCPCPSTLMNFMQHMPEKKSYEITFYLTVVVYQKSHEINEVHLNYKLKIKYKIFKFLSNIRKK